MDADVRLTLGGACVRLLGGRALQLPDHRALLIADLHLGKADIFRRAGIALPVGGTGNDLERLQQLVERSGCTELWILGDILHGPVHRAPWYQRWLAWREQHPQLQVHVVRGNHDRDLASAAMRVQIHDTQASLGPFLLRHEPQPDAAAHVIAGHLHPLASLPGISRRLPAFWLRKDVTVLPAFSGFTAGVVPRLQSGEQLVVCVDDQAMALPVMR